MTDNDDEKKAEAYNMEALWSAVKQSRADLIEARAMKANADVRAANAAHALDSATKQDLTLRTALSDVLNGDAAVQWHAVNKAYRVRYTSEEKQDLWIPKVRGEQSVRGTVTPPNAANVGSSVQGQAGTPPSE